MVTEAVIMCRLTISVSIDENDPAHGRRGSVSVAMLFFQHVACGVVGTPSLTCTVEVGVPPSICHLPPARGVSGVSHGICLIILPSGIQAVGYLESAFRKARRFSLGLQ